MDRTRISYVGWDLRTSAMFTNRLCTISSAMAGSYNGDTYVILYQTSERITELNMDCVIKKISVLLYFINNETSNLFASFFPTNMVDS